MPGSQTGSTAETKSTAAYREGVGTGRRLLPPPLATLPRPRLTDRLRRAVPGQVVLLTAPAGYSKTTCLREWEEMDPRPFAFVGCTARHDDPAVLASSIVDALEGIAPVEAGVLQSLAALKPNIDTVVSRLAKSLEASATQTVIVLDDVHLLREPATHELLACLAEALPANAQLAIGSRSEPPLRLGRLRANRRLLAIGDTELAMTREESALMLLGMGLELSEAELASLHARTEGWPAALYLAALALTDESDPASAIADFAGDDRLVVDYLREELLATLSPSQAAFLVRTSILDELSGPICDVVLERTDSARMLRDLSRANALIVPLDRKDERFRCHHLLAEMLRAELRHREPEAAPGIHSRASRWYSERGDIDRAVEHAIAADELGRAGELVWQAVPELAGRGRLATLDRWLAEIGEGRVARSAPLALSCAHRHVALGDGAAATHWAHVANAAADASGPIDDELRADLHVIAATLAPGSIAAMGTDAKRAAELMREDDPWQAPAMLYSGVSAQLAGDSDRASPLLREAVRRGALVSPVIQVVALAQLALGAAEGAELDEAERLIAQAHEQVCRCDLFDYPSMAMVFAAAALIFGTQGRVVQALDHIAHARDLVADCRSFPAWYEAEARIVLARACVRADELEPAAALLREAEVVCREIPDAPVLARWAREAGEALERANATRDAYSLTKAELRTLQYLPTHLAFREIGERLFLSANTVKTQARAVYRKLGAASRTEAVERAREAGLLPGEPG